MGKGLTVNPTKGLGFRVSRCRLYGVPGPGAVATRGYKGVSGR